MFFSPTKGNTFTIPYAMEEIRRVVSTHKEELNLSGFKQVLYLEKPENSNRYWKVIIAIWPKQIFFDEGLPPSGIARITLDNFETIVKDKYTGKYVEWLSRNVYEEFLMSGYRSFY